MRRIWDLTAGPLACLLLLGAGGVAPALAQEMPLSVAYGPSASTAEGDHDFRELIYLSVPADLQDRLYLRILDPDTGGDHDLIYGGSEDTEIRYALVGGDGALSGLASTIAPSADDLAGGEPIRDASFAASAALDGKWLTVASFLPDQGELVGDRRVFRLLVEGLAGNDANLYAATLSLRDRRNLAPDGLEIFAFAPTVRVPDDDSVTELRFVVPAEADRLVLHNFDAANGEVTLTTALRSVPLAASGQNEWREGEVAVLERERGEPAAITFAGGEEIPNDATFYVTDAAGQALAIELPVRAWVPNTRPVPVADVELLANCFSVAFDASRSSDADGDGLSYVWDFGDGQRATGRVLVHQYPGPGTYAAELQVLDSSGQVGNGAAQRLDVMVKRPPIADAGEDLVVAPGDAVAFDGSASLAGERPIARHLWDFYDGAQGAGETSEHVFASPGRYIVTLTVEDDSSPPCNFDTDERIVRVNAPPVAEAGDRQRAAVGQQITLDGNRSYDVDGDVVDFAWDLADGTTETGPVIQHVFATPGTYDVRLTVRDDAGVANSESSDTVRIAVNAPPVAEAGPDRSLAIGEVTSFDASATTDADGAIVDYRWDFGDGARGTGARVDYAYPRSGTYRVTLTVRDDSATATNLDTDGLTVVVNEPPVADAGPDQIVTTSEVRFDGGGSSDADGAIARYEWDFGDGTTGSSPAPTHVYNKSGVYQVTLSVTDDSGTIRSSDSDSLRVVVNEAPIADAGPDMIGAPGQVLTFTGSGSIDPDGDVIEHLWDFKDGAVASGGQVSHSFERPGTYYVRLQVRDDTEHSSAFDYDEAKVVINAPPVAKAGQDILAGPGDAVRFDGGNSFDIDGSIAAWRWDFSDDESFQLGREVVRAYPAPGVYTARLTVTDDSGAINAVAQDEVVIRINHAPVASAGPDINSGRTTVSFDASQSADADGDALTYRWDFGDGTPPAGGAQVTHTYATGGAYPVVLTVDDGTGLWNATASAAITVVINRPPVAVAGVNKDACAGDIVVFDGSASHDPDGGLLRYRWDLGDGTGAEIVNPTKVYTRGGIYPVTLAVQDESGFPNDTHTARIVVRVDESPIAVAGPDQMACANADVHFDGSASRDFDGVVNRYSWNFGDNTISGGEKPVHVYREPGEYRVVLTITGDQAGQCDNSHSDEMIVRVVEAPVARIEAPERIPVGEPAVFDGTGSSGAEGEIVAWRWDFGDGASAEGPVAEHRYAAPGAYVARLAIETDSQTSQCNMVSAQQLVVANAAPQARAGADQVAGVAQEVLFDASESSDADGAITAYRWDFGDGAQASGMNVRHQFAQSGRYPVTLTVMDDTDLPNNTASDTLTVTVNRAPAAVIAVPDAACPGEELAFSGAGSLDEDGQITRFEWDFGDGTTAAEPEVAHTYRSPGIYEVALTVDDGTALNNSRHQSTIDFHVNRAPRAEAGPDRMVCPGEPVAFDASMSVDWDGALVRHRWDFGDGTSADGEQVLHSFEQPGVYEVRLAVTDDSGARCATSTDVARVHVNAPPLAVAGGDRGGFVGGAHDGLLFDASQSADADGRPLSYVWDLGDGITRTGEKVLHSYGEEGEYVVRLAVSDGSGLACGQSLDEIKVDVRRRE
jgi:PKD repeat protein